MGEAIGVLPDKSPYLPFDDDLDELVETTLDRTVSEFIDSPEFETGEGARVADGVLGKN